MGDLIKYFIRRFLGGIFFYTGIFRLVLFWNNVRGRRITIVTYHRIADRKISEMEASLPFLFTSQKVFEKQLNFIKNYYRVITFKELNEYFDNNRLAWNSLIITFDDGYEDNFRRARRSLDKMDLPATFFITVDKIGNNHGRPFWWDRLYYYLKEIQKREHRRLSNEVKVEFIPLYEEFKHNTSGLFSRLNKEETANIEKLLDRMGQEFGINNEKLLQENRMLSWDQVSEMGRHHDVGSHTCSHGNLLKLSDGQKYHEIVESKTIIEKSTNRRVSVFSSPAGHMNEDIERFVEKGGYEFAVSAGEPGINGMTTDRYHLKRINVWEGTSLSLNGKFSKGYFSYKLLGF
jgi:peptidoglycan/xylan/chitin deacetylase (PgdA/CDA1 family)